MVAAERHTDISIYCFSTGLETKPKLSELQKHVRPMASVVDKWEEVGLALGLGDDDYGEQLDRIREDKNGDNGSCFIETVKIWLRSGPSSQTWAALITAIKNVDGLETVGEQIKAWILSASKPIMA